MLEAGSTMTWEAWDWRYKNNLDWNHAWGAAPANVIPRGLMGVQPLAPGFAHAAVAPQPGPLRQVALRLPTIRGPITVALEQILGQRFALNLALPANMTAEVTLPLQGAWQVTLDRRPVAVQTTGTGLRLARQVRGTRRLEARRT